MVNISDVVLHVFQSLTCSVKYLKIQAYFNQYFRITLITICESLLRAIINYDELLSNLFETFVIYTLYFLNGWFFYYVVPIIYIN
jgi:hypothetical protein